MNEEQYTALCEACDHTLLAADSTIERIAIPWLHVVREHPALLKEYECLFEQVSPATEFARTVFQFFRSQAAWLWHLLKSSFSTAQYWHGPKLLPRQVDYIFVSHLLNESFVGEERDFYYGDLPAKLVAQGHSVLIILTNYSGLPGRVLADKWSENVVPRVIISESLGVQKERMLYRRLKTESLKIKAGLNGAAAGLLHKVIFRSAQLATSGGALWTLRLGEQVGLMVDKLKPKAIVVTYEGHAWERVAIAAARNAHPEVRCIGYQHAALFRLQHGIRRSLTRKYNPDVILTSGEISKRKLQSVPDLHGVKIATLGSNRAFVKTPLGRTSKSDPENTGSTSSAACLVLPEGFQSECQILFEFSLECAKTLPEINFIWRLHPSVTYEVLAAANPKLRNLPKNVVLSQGTLDEDILNSAWTLYRGTTAVVQAVAAGLRPIYLQLAGEMTIDPLYELDGWRANVASVAEFRGICHDENSGDQADFEVTAAVRYCEELFTPLDVEVVTSLI